MQNLLSCYDSSNVIELGQTLYDYDACFIYHPNSSKRIEAITRQLEIDSLLKIVSYNWHSDTAGNLQYKLGRSAACVVFLDDNLRWEAIPFRNDLVQQVTIRVIRLIFVLFDGSKAPDFSQSELIDYQGEASDNYQNLETAIVGYRPSKLTYNITADIPVEFKSSVVLSGTFLPVSNYSHRPELEAMRDFWRDEKRNGVLSLVGMGGSGKTALLTRFLQDLPNHPLSESNFVSASDLPPANGLFVWSFYDNPNIEYFIRGLYEQLTGITTRDPARDIVYRLIRHLETHPVQRLLIALDGLEIVQEERDSTGGYGLLRDSSLRHFVRRIAQGDLPIKMLITSRYLLPELQPFADKGYWQLETNYLSDESARRFLRERGINGSDSELNTLIAEYGSHILTLEHLAQILSIWFKSNPDAAKNFPDTSDNPGDEQAKRLARVLTIYEQQLAEEELAVLQVISIVRKPISVTLLTTFFEANTDEGSSGTIYQTETITFKQIVARLQQLRATPRGAVTVIQQILAKLQQLNLVAFYGAKSELVCTIHPAIRDYFSQVAVDKPGIRESVSNRIISLIHHYKPDIMQLRKTQPALLDIYEQLLYHSLSDNSSKSGYDATWWYERRGGYQQLAWRTGDYQRGLRMTSAMMNYLGWDYVDVRFSPLHEHNLFLLDAGRPALAEELTRQLLQHCRFLASIADDMPEGRWNNPFAYWQQHQKSLSYAMYEGIVLQTLCDALLAQGKLIEAEALMNDVISEQSDWQVMGAMGERRTGSNPYGRRALARFYLGDVESAHQDFIKADTFAARYTSIFFLRSSDWYHKAFQARLLARLGKLSAARKRLATIDMEQMRQYRPLSIAQFDLALAEIAYLSGNSSTAQTHIENALGWAMQSGQQQIYTQAHIQQAQLLLRAKKYNEAFVSLSEAESVARSSNFNLQLADALILSGHQAFETGDMERAEAIAKEALSVSETLTYRWSVGDAAYLLAKIALRREQLDSAVTYARQSLEVRQSIQDPRTQHTQALIQAIENRK